MTNIYCANVVSNSIVGIDTLAIEIDAAANTELKIRKIRVTHGDGTETGTIIPDYHKTVEFVRESAAGTGGTSYTPIPVDGSTTASTSTVFTGAFTLGTISNTVDILAPNSMTDLIWQAVDEDDKIVVTPGSIFGLTINVANQV